MKGFAVDFWSWMFYKLRWISPFQIILTLIPATKGNYTFTDAWVLGNLLLSILLFLICSAPGLRWWEAIAVVYGGIRVFEVIVYQVNLLLFDAYRAAKQRMPSPVASYRRLVILALHNYAEIIFWFALFYRNFDWAFRTGKFAVNSLLVAANFSFVTMTTFGYSDIRPTEALGTILTLVQSVIGLFMVLVLLAHYISLIPQRRTMDAFESV